MKKNINTSDSFCFEGGFTVLMAVYRGDDAILFERAVDSVYENSLQPDDFILVIDGPVDGLMNNLIAAMKIKYGFNLIQLPKNVGLARALNRGLENIKTKWVVRADADDYNLPDRFLRQAKAVNQSPDDIDIIGGAIQEVDKDGSQLAVRRTVECHDDICKFAAHRNPFNHMTVAFKVDFARRSGGYPDIHLKEDYALWVSMLAAGARALNLSAIIVNATAGREMYRRRGGLRYALAEFALQKHLVDVGFKSNLTAFFHGLTRSTVFLLPSPVRGWVYERHLRRRN